MGLLGAGQQGRRLLRAASAKYLAVKSIADIRPSNRKLAAELVKDAHAYDSYEELLAAAKKDGLEAVIIALPSHLHAPAALAALDKGLHVFIEPPMAPTVADAKKIVAKSEEKKLVAAVGQQRHYNLIYDYALEMVREGKDLLDQPHYLRAQWHLAKPEKAAGESAGGAAKTNGDKIDWWPDVPKQESGTDFAGYGSPEELVRWRFYEKYSGGLLAELGSQLFDAAVMLVKSSPNHDPKRPYPLSVAGAASQVLRDAEGDIDDHVHCIFEYPIKGYVDAKEVPPKARRKIALQFDLLLGSDFDTYGETVLGRRGSLVLEGERRGMIYYMADSNKVVRVTQKKDDKRRRPVRRCWTCPRTASPTRSPKPWGSCSCAGPTRASPPSWSTGPTAAGATARATASPAATPAPGSTRPCSRWPQRRPSSSARASISRTSGLTPRAKIRRTGCRSCLPSWSILVVGMSNIESQMSKEGRSTNGLYYLPYGDAKSYYFPISTRPRLWLACAGLLFLAAWLLPMEVKGDRLPIGYLWVLLFRSSASSDLLAFLLVWTAILAVPAVVLGWVIHAFIVICTHKKR